MVYQQQTGRDQMIVAEPNRSASWQANKMVLIAMCCLSGVISVGFALLGAWPILPFAGLEMLALGSALYYVSWKLRYRHVITIGPHTVTVQKGHYFPRKQWELAVDQAALSVVPEQHPWDGPAISLVCDGEEVPLGEFLNRDDSLKLLSHLQDRLRIGNHSPRSRREF